jgi:adenosine deaminase
MARDLRTLPKAHLHLHLEAGMRPSTLADLAAKYSVPVPQIRGYGSFAAFSDMYVGAIEVLRERDDWERFADELMADQAADGAVYIEPSFGAINHRSRFGTDRAAWEYVLPIFETAAARHGLALRWMVPVDRVMESSADACDTARLAVSLVDHGAVSFGLHNDEVGHPPEDFVDAFRIARAGGLASTPHAGELEHGEFVARSVELLGATRIQHGVRAFEVPGLVERLAAAQVCLDVCPTSNLMLSVFPSLAEHTLPALLDAGVPCSVNADDPLLFGPGLLDEYQLCRDQFGFGDERMAYIARCSIEFGGCPPETKEAALAGIDAWLDGAP